MEKMPKIPQNGFSISGEIPHPWKTPAIFAMAQLKAANYNVEFLSAFRGHRCAFRLNFGFGNSVTSRDHRNPILYKMQHIGSEKLSTAMNLTFMNDTSLDKAPVFTMSDEINERRDQRILDQVNKHKYTDFIKKMNSIPDSGFLHGSIIEKLRTTAIASNNLVVYQYLVRRFTNEIVSQSDDTMKKIICPGVSVDTFAGIISSRPKLCTTLKEPACYMSDMIDEYYNIINDNAPESCNCLEDLMSKITCLLETSRLHPTPAICDAFCNILNVYDEHIAIHPYSNRILYMLLKHAQIYDCVIDFAHINEYQFDTLRISKQPLIFLKSYHEILKLPIDFTNQQFGNSLWAVRDIECGKYLIENGVDVNWTNQMGHNVVQDMICNLQWTQPEDVGGNLLRYMQWLVAYCNVDMGNTSQIEDWIQKYLNLQYDGGGISAVHKLFKYPKILVAEIKQENLNVINWVRGYMNSRNGSKKLRHG